MGINIHGIGVGYFYAVLKDGSLIVDQYIYTERLFGASATKKTDKTLLLVLRFLKATTPFVVFIFYFRYGFWSVLLCSRNRYASILLASCLD